MKRLSAREFRATFPSLTEPVLVNNGIWFPEAGAAHLALAEGGTVRAARAAPKLDLSKSAQARGRMSHKVTG